MSDNTAGLSARNVGLVARDDLCCLGFRVFFGRRLYE